MQIKLDTLTRIIWRLFSVTDIERMVEKDRVDNHEAGIIIEDGMITGYII